MNRWDYYNRYFPPSVPRAAKGGIRAQSKRGAFGESWWAKRWVEVLESFEIGARLHRGRSYARKGQVLSIHVEKGMIKAKVQGSRPKPYEVKITVKTLVAREWKRLAQALSCQALFVAKLLAGEMPREIEQVFEGAGLALFPRTAGDLTTDCSCPDWSNPCKHTAAVYYLLGEEFDRDPFLIFRMRGASRQEFLGLLGGVSGPTEEPSEGPAARTSRPADLNLAVPVAEALDPDRSRFWKAGEVPQDVWPEMEALPTHAVLLKGLGKFPFWRGAAGLWETLSPTYARASERGLRMWLGEPE